MRHLCALIGLSLLATAPAVAKPRLSPEAELAEAVKGRVAGKPVGCIANSNVRNVRIVDRTALIYDAGSVVYVNRPDRGAEQLDRWDTLVTRTHNSQLCRPDIVRLYSNGFEQGSIFLGDFVPYRRVRAADR
jgi:hypothetical protein